MDVAEIFVASTISNHPVLITISMIVIESREYAFDGVLIVNGWETPDPYRPCPRDCVSDSAMNFNHLF
jgi:hypothetical protein